MLNILVTGGAGYVGSVLCDLLSQNKDYNVTCYDNFMWNNVGSVQNLLNRPNFDIIKGDVRNISSDLLNSQNVIMHLAAWVGAPLCNKDEKQACEVNYRATLDIVEKTNKDIQIIYPNTNSGYGIGGEEKCTEETPLNPISIYGKTKSDGEKAVLDRGNSVSFRLATVFGVSGRPRMDLMVNDFIFQLYFKGQMTIFEPHFRRNFVGVKDIARAFVWAINREGVYNLGLDEANCTKLELAQKLLIVNPNAQINIGQGKDPDKRDYIVSSEKIMNMGFKFKENLETNALQVKKLCQLYGYKISEFRNY